MDRFASNNRRRTIGIGALGALLIVALALGASYALRQKAHQEWSQRMDGLSLVLSEQAVQTLSSAHTVLGSVVEAVNAAHLQDGDAFRAYAGREAQFQLLADKAKSNPVIDVVTLVANDGEVLNFSRTFPPPKIDLASRDYFQAHQADPALEVFTSAPVRNKGNGNWVFYISRRINNSQGDMLGLVLVGVSVEVFSNIYARVGVGLGDGASIGLYRDDYTLMTRWPLVYGRIGVKEQPEAQHAQTAQSPRDNHELAAGTSDLVASRGVEPYPLMVVATVSEARYLQNWRNSVAWIAATAALSLLLVFVSLRWLLQAEQTRREAADGLEARVAERTLALTQEIAGRERSQQELAIHNARIAAISHSAGKAEVANSVLHNVGNVLNSVNVSISVIHDQLQRSALADFPRTVDLLGQHAHDLAGYLGNDDEGRQVGALLELLARQWEVEQKRLLSEAGQLRNSVDHIRSIVSRQQSFSGMAELSETFEVAQVIDQALSIHRDALERGGITVQTHYNYTQPWTGDSSKLAQIMLNLIINAEESVALSDCVNGAIDITVDGPGEGMLKITVTDNGLGIPASVLGKLFQYGFTTKRTGHGFGLHASALAAQEMGGALQAFSPGPNRGATFELRLPTVGSPN